MLSIAFVSLYGHPVHSGSSHPVDYPSLALPLKQWPWSDNFSSSTLTIMDSTITVAGIIAEAIPARALTAWPRPTPWAVQMEVRHLGQNIALNFLLIPSSVLIQLS